ncbi:MAG: VTT domain-containing protein [Candidatus Bathyarchaeia archaeon]
MEFSSIIKWFLTFLKVAGNPYIEAFLASFLGNLMLFFPVPYLTLIFTISMKTKDANFLFLTFIGALGAALGKMLSYGVGRGGGKLLGKKYEKKFNALKKLLGKSPLIAAFIAAASPLPDDIIFLPLGLIKYDLIKTFLACLAGKFVITFLTISLGRFSREVISWIFKEEETNYLIVVTSIIVILISTIIMIKVDWEKFFEKVGRKIEVWKKNMNSFYSKF